MPLMLGKQARLEAPAAHRCVRTPLALAPPTHPPTRRSFVRSFARSSHAPLFVWPRRARRVMTKIKANEILDDAQRLAQALKEVARLKAKLKDVRSKK